MRKLLITWGITTTLFACQQAPPANVVHASPDSMVMMNTDTMIIAQDTTVIPVMVESWKHFQSLNGKYAHEIHLLDMEPLKKRWRQLLGSKENENDFLQRYQVMPPIEIEEGVLYNEGCKPHNCAQDEAAIAVDMRKDIVYLGIAKNKVVRLYAEKGDTSYPDKMKKWKLKMEEETN
ncbi:hypothetical protein LX64_03329 [Chitinophaga skermanii]|uniref:Uncharacterized protein n=1 Tax=Chitinophaga skermanii TaxID=331697 RepID=A0A327QCW9_9BACT|nr:hypothetical protein [Chitinophaga skermanii]RAJ02320.1 hypothetical protein LX64_03329 [Chitinophaga skermanii]